MNEVTNDEVMLELVSLILVYVKDIFYCAVFIAIVVTVRTFARWKH